MSDIKIYRSINSQVDDFYCKDMKVNGVDVLDKKRMVFTCEAGVYNHNLSQENYLKCDFDDHNIVIPIFIAKDASEKTSELTKLEFVCNTKQISAYIVKFSFYENIISHELINELINSYIKEEFKLLREIEDIKNENYKNSINFTKYAIEGAEIKADNNEHEEKTADPTVKLASINAVLNIAMTEKKLLESTENLKNVEEKLDELRKTTDEFIKNYIVRVNQEQQRKRV